MGKKNHRVSWDPFISTFLHSACFYKYGRLQIVQSTTSTTVCGSPNRRGSFSYTFWALYLQINIDRNERNTFHQWRAPTMPTIYWQLNHLLLAQERKKIQTCHDPAIAFFFFLFRAAPMAYGGSRLGVKSELQLPTYTTAHGNARTLTHGSRPGMEPATSWFLVRFVFAAPWWELPIALLKQ